MSATAAADVDLTPAIGGGNLDLEAPLRVTAALSGFELATVDPFLPDDLHDLRGRIEGRADVAGTVAAPRVSGETHLRDGALTVVPMRRRYTAIEMDAWADPDRIVLENLSVTAGAGSVQLDGAAVRQGETYEAKLRMRAERFPLEQPGVPRMSIDAAAETRATLGAGETDVHVSMGATRIDVKGTNVPAPEPIPASDRVVVLDDSPTAETPPPAPLATNAAAPDPAVDDGPPAHEDVPDGETPSGQTRVRVVLAEPLEIRGPGVDIAFNGGIGLESGPGGTFTSGSLTNRGGHFELLSNRFVIQDAIVTLPPSGEPVPFVDIEAMTQLGEYEITARITGRVTRPKLELSSEPAASESTIFGMLVSGTSTPAEGPEAAKQAAALLATFASPALARQLNDALYVDSISLGVGDSAAQPVLSVGKNLSRTVDVQTRYQFGADPLDRTRNKAEVGLRYRFKPRWSVETYFGDAPAGGAGVFWGRSFDRDRPKRGEEDPGPDIEGDE